MSRPQAKNRSVGVDRLLKGQVSPAAWPQRREILERPGGRGFS